MKRAVLRRKTPLQSRGAIVQLSKSPIAEIKRNIQSILRERAIVREASCGSIPKPVRHQDCELILQAAHLVTRSNSISSATCATSLPCANVTPHYFKPQRFRLSPFDPIWASTVTLTTGSVEATCAPSSLRPSRVL
jgi:hypothetical protein